MAGANAPLTTEQGAQTPVWLALADRRKILKDGQLENGQFYKNQQLEEW